MNQLKNKIEELTPDQEALVEKYFEMWMAEGHSTQKLNKKDIQKSATALWSLFDLKAPIVHYTSGPQDAIKLAQKLGDSRKGIDIVGDFLYGTWDFYWVLHYRFGLELDPEIYEASDRSEIETVLAFAKAVPMCLCYENAIIVCERVLRITTDNEERLHNEHQAALEYADGTTLFMWHDVQVPDYVILEPHKITVDLMDAEGNIEVRRVMIERYGLQRYIIDSNAIIIHQDTDPLNSDKRVLYRKEVAGDEAIVTVHVKNSTPESDGSIKDYFIRVPPVCQTTQEALSWTFGLESHEYYPLVQT